MSDVAAIVADVRARGDVAVREWALRLDGVEPARATPGSGLPEEAVLALADNVRRWHEAQRPADVRLEIRPGVELERRWLPLGSVGIYVPRGLVSTLVMCAVPALVAGVERIVVATPPDGTGLVAAAAQLLGVGEVWSLDDSDSLEDEPESLDDVLESLGAVGSRYSGVSSLRGVSLMSCVPSGVACVRVQI